VLEVVIPKRYPIELRRDVTKRLLAGASVTELARETSLSRGTPLWQPPGSILGTRSLQCLEAGSSLTQQSQSPRPYPRCRRVAGISERRLTLLRTAHRKRREVHQALVSPVDSGFNARLRDLSRLFITSSRGLVRRISDVLDFYRTFLRESPHRILTRETNNSTDDGPSAALICRSRSHKDVFGKTTFQ
jgi:hypothetical protein